MNNDSIQLATLCSGNLHPDVAESMLLQKFSFVGPVYSIQLCRNKRTGTSLQYAVVNFQQQQADGERILEVLIFDTLLRQPICVTWFKGNSSLRKSKMEKDFIKTLEKSIDSMPLYNTLSTFGNVMSCEPGYIKNGCRGLGYVHIEKSEAKTGVKKLTRMLINDQQLFITHLKSNHEHEDGNKIIMTDVNSKQVDDSQAQKKEKGHPKHQFEQIPTDTYTSIRQDKPHSSTQDIQLHWSFSLPLTPLASSPGFQNVPEVADPSRTVVLAAVPDRDKNAVSPDVPIIIKLNYSAANSGAIQSVEPGDPAVVPATDIKGSQPAVPSIFKRTIPAAEQEPLAPVIRSILKKSVPDAAHVAVKKTVSFAIPIAAPAIKSTVQPAVPSITKRVAPAAVQEALSPAVQSILKKAVPIGTPAAVKKTVSFAVPVAVPDIKNAVQPAVSSIPKKTVPADVPAADKNSLAPAVPTILKRAVPDTEQEAPSPEVFSILNKTVSPTSPCKKAEPFAGPIAVPVIKKVIHPAVATIRKRAVPASKKDALSPVVHSILKNAVPTVAPVAIKKTALFARPVAVPAIKKVVQPAVPSRPKRAVSVGVPAANKNTLAPAVPSIVKREVLAAEQEALPPAVPSILQKAFPTASPAKVKKASPFAHPIEVPAIKKAVRSAVSTIPNREAPVAKQKVLPPAAPIIPKKAVSAAAPAAVKKATSFATAPLKNAVQPSVATIPKGAALSAKQKALTTAVASVPRKAVPTAALAADKKLYALQSPLQLLPLKLKYNLQSQLRPKKQFCMPVLSPGCW